MPRALHRLLFLFLVVLAGPARAGAQQAALEAEVKQLAFTGNQAFPSDSLELAIINRQTECLPLLGLLCRLGWGFADRNEYLDRRELGDDLARLRVYHFQRGYREARVDTVLTYAPDGSEVTLRFDIQEGQPIVIDSLGFRGQEDAQVPGLLERLPIAEGDPLSGIQLDAARDSLVSRLRNAGYVDAAVFRFIDISPPGSHRAVVILTLDPGARARFGPLDVRVSGEAELSRDVVLRMLPFQEGGTFSAEQVRQAQRNLYNLEIVRSALIAVDSARWRAGPDTLVPHVVEVGTSTLHRVRTGAGWSQSECMNAEALWVSRNFMGGARRLQVRGRVSNVLAEDLHRTACGESGVDEFGGLNWILSTELHQPWVLSPRNSLTTSVFWERQTLPDVFIRKAVGLNVVFTRTLGTRLPLVVSYRPQRASLDAAGIFFCTSFLVCQPEDVTALEEPNWLSPLGAGITLDRTDNILNPSAGYSSHLDFEYASTLTGSDFGYTRTVADASWYRSLARRATFAARLRAGWVGAAQFVDINQQGLNIIHPQKRFFAGGASSVRGFAQNRLGPRVLTVGAEDLLDSVSVVGGDTLFLGPCTPETIASLTCDPAGGSLTDKHFTPRPTGGTRLLEGSAEYRFALGNDFQGVMFTDFGQVWSERQSVSLRDLEWTPGLGVRYLSPIGPVRADLAYRFAGGVELPVVTYHIRPFRPGEDAADDRISLPQKGAPKDEDGNPISLRIPWVREQELAFLAPPFPFEKDLGVFRRLQLHISIGQAF